MIIAIEHIFVLFSLSLPAARILILDLIALLFSWLHSRLASENAPQIAHQVVANHL
jgi:hypothetical protein